MRGWPRPRLARNPLWSGLLDGELSLSLTGGMGAEVDRLDWAEVEEVITPIISTWSLGSELARAEHAWGFLSQRG